MSTDTPEALRDEAARQARLAQQWARIDCRRTAEEHETRAKELAARAAELEAAELRS